MKRFDFANNTKPIPMRRFADHAYIQVKVSKLAEVPYKLIFGCPIKHSNKTIGNVLEAIGSNMILEIDKNLITDRHSKEISDGLIKDIYIQYDSNDYYVDGA